VAPDGNSVGNTSADSDRRAFPNFDEPSHESTRSDTCKIVEYAVVVHRTGCIDDGELSNAGSRPYVRPSENSSALAKSGGRRDYGGRMLDDRKLCLRKFLRQIGIDLAAPPVIPDGYYDIFDPKLSTNASCPIQFPKHCIISSSRSNSDRIIEKASDTVISGKLNCVDQDGRMA